MTCPPKTDPHVKLEWWIKGRQGNEQETVYSGADHWEAAGSRSGPVTGGDDGPGLPYSGHCRADLLSVAPGVRWFKDRAGQAAEGPGAREYPAETGGGGSHVGQTDPPGGSKGKLLSPTRRQQCIEHIRKALPVSERRV